MGMNKASAKAIPLHKNREKLHYCVGGGFSAGNDLLGQNPSSFLSALIRVYRRLKINTEKGTADGRRGTPIRIRDCVRL